MFNFFKKKVLEQNGYWIIGIGSFGGRAIEFLSVLYPDIEMYALDTEIEDLSKLKLENKILIGEMVTGGYRPLNIENAKKAFEISSKKIKKTLKSKKDKKLFIITGIGQYTGTSGSLEVVRIANSLKLHPHILAICFMLWGKNKDPKGIVKNFFNELNTLDAGISYFDEEFLRRVTGPLKMNDAFEETCRILKAKLDEIVEQKID